MSLYCKKEAGFKMSTHDKKGAGYKIKRVHKALEIESIASVSVHDKKGAGY